MRKLAVIGVLVLSGSVVVSAYAAGNWSAAENKAKLVKREHKDLRKITPSETRKIVDAVCRAEEAKRKTAAADAGKRAKHKVATEYAGLKTLKDDANRLLNDVLADTALSTHHGDAHEYKRDIARRWASITRMTRSIRGANHPVIAYMLDEGKKAHTSYQREPGNCDASEFSMSSGRVDCLKADSPICTVIELKPDNRKAIGRGAAQARKYMRELRTRGPAFRRLVKQDGAFADCEGFKSRVHCYTLCPEIGENGEFIEASPTWRKNG